MLRNKNVIRFVALFTIVVLISTNSGKQVLAVSTDDINQDITQEEAVDNENESSEPTPVPSLEPVEEPEPSLEPEPSADPEPMVEPEPDLDSEPMPTPLPTPMPSPMEDSDTDAVKEILLAEEADAAISYDYFSEKIFAKEGYELSLSTEEISPSSEFSISELLDSADNRVIYLRRKETVETAATEWYEVNLPGRPEAPVLSVQKTSTDKEEDGKILGTTVAMEYRLKGDSDYIRANDEETIVKSGTYQVRLAATEDSFAGQITEITVSSLLILLSEETGPVIENQTASRDDIYVGDVLKVRTKADIGISYQWFANNVAIKDATGDTLKLPASTYNKTITVRAMQAANSDGEGHPDRDIFVTSKAVGPVKKEPGGTISESDFRNYLSIEYDKENAKISSGYELSASNSSKIGTVSLKLTSIIDKSSDRYYYVRRKSTSTREASEWYRMSVKARPATPTGLLSVSASSKDAEDGKIIGTNTGMEYRLSGTYTYKRAKDKFTVVKAGKYLFRYAATSSDFVSRTVTVDVGDNGVLLKDDEAKPVAFETTGKASVEEVADDSDNILELSRAPEEKSHILIGDQVPLAVVSTDENVVKNTSDFNVWMYLFWGLAGCDGLVAILYFIRKKKQII